jgi:hypothetical protein
VPDFTLNERRIMGTVYKETSTKPLPAGGRFKPDFGRAEGYRNQRFEAFAACTAACTESRQCEKIGVKF